MEAGYSRQVRSLRVTDDTWKALGIAAECFGMSRADYLEQVIRGNASPSITWEKESVNQAKTTVAELATTPLSVATLETVRDPRKWHELIQDEGSVLLLSNLLDLLDSWRFDGRLVGVVGKARG